MCAASPATLIAVSLLQLEREAASQADPHLPTYRRSFAFLLLFRLEERPCQG